MQLHSARAKAALARDADELSDALEDLARVYQLQDPRQACAYGINLTECYSLEAVARDGPLTVNEIAARLAMDKATASRAVASLARKGYVRSRVHPTDSRALQVRATAAGERLYAHIHESGRALHRRLLADVPADVRARVTSLIRRLVDAETRCASGSGKDCTPC
jgi:DNA-binding MarR family transcriptional regulator